MSRFLVILEVHVLLRHLAAAITGLVVEASTVLAAVAMLGSADLAVPLSALRRRDA